MGGDKLVWIIFLCSITPWELHPVAETCRLLTIVTNIISLSALVCWCAGLKNMHGIHNDKISVNFGLKVWPGDQQHYLRGSSVTSYPLTMT